MPRLNIERQEQLEPKRMDYAFSVLNSLGYTVVSLKDKCLQFTFKNETVYLYPYSGYFNGKSVKAGRGIQNLIEQVKQK